jgi:hypothetical protein
MKSGSLSLLEPPGPVQACNGIALPYSLISSIHYSNIQRDATLHSLFYLETALQVSGSTYTHFQERKQLYLQHLLLVTPLLLPAAIAGGSSNGVTGVDTVVRAPDVGWRFHPKHVEQFPDKINCVKLHHVGY